MTRRRLLPTLGVGLAVVVVAGAAWWASLPRPRITASNCARIKKGMRWTEVGEILGGEPDSAMGQSFGYEPAWSSGCWVGEWGCVTVRFDNNGAVTDAGFVSNGKPTFWQHLRRLFP